MKDWHREAVKLREKGLNYRQIGERLDRTHSAVWKACNPERAKSFWDGDNPARNEYKREWDHANTKRVCPVCGGQMGIRSKYEAYKQCQSCRFRDAERNRQAIVAGYQEGLTAWQIAERTGIPKNTITAEAHRLRLRGVDVPHAKTGRPAHRVAA